MNSANVATEELLGSMIAGRYRIISRLGAGGMGVAYRAWDEQGGLPVVIKIPKRIFLGDPKFAERFHREIRLLQGLKHPHIVPIVDVGGHEGLPFVVMRFLPGGSLSNRRLRDEQGKPRQNSPAMLHLWLPAIAEALDYVHSQGVVHRDMKPANIFFDAFWGAYLGDFGIAKIVEESDTFDKEHTLTATHMGIGTQEYMAPEQFTPKVVIDGRADQYALGVVVYEMLAGKRPFTGETAHLIVEVTTYAVPPLPVTRFEVPPMLAQAVYRALAKQPAQRFSTCREFAAAALREVPPMSDESGVARLLCPQCSNILKLPTAAAGQKGKCPKCQTQMKVADDLGALWLLDEDLKQRKAVEIGGDESPGTPSDGVDEKELETFKPVSTETPIPPKKPRLPQPVLVAGVAAVMLALLVIAIALFGGTIEPPPPPPPPPPPYDVRLAAALQTLERDSLDKDANDFVAWHYCLKQKDWEKGLPYLAKSAMKEAATLATEEIAANEAEPINPGTMIRLARKWWEFGCRTDLSTPESAAATQLHAKDIYSEQTLRVTDQNDANWTNQWLDSDKGFAQLVKNLRPAMLISEPVLYLSELPEVEARVVHFGFGKGTINGPQNAIRSIVDGQPSPHGLSMHPGGGPDGQCFARYKLPEGCARLKSIVTLDQSGSFEHCGIGFEVVADGRSVWKSNTIDKSHQSEQCDVAIPGCRNLELRTYAVTGAFGGHAVWIEPRIVIDPPNTGIPDGVTSLVADRAAAEWVLQRDGSVEIELADKSRKRLVAPEEEGGRLLDQAGQFWVVGIELTAKPNVTDQGLACVAGLSRLEWLCVGGTAVTDALFDHLRTLPNLRGIGVNWTGVSGHGLASLADSQLRHLEISGMKDPEVAVVYLHKKGVAEWINFDGMKMTPECVRLLGEMKTLKTLHFRNGLITEEQLETLKKLLPSCHFHIWK